MATTGPEVQSPEWWVKRLSETLDARQPSVRLAINYYEGRHNLAYATRKFRATFGGLFKEFSDNWCGVVVQAPAERMKIDGIRLSGDDSGGSDTAWEMWQRNELDAWSALHHASTLAAGYGYVLVWADPDGYPKITVEDPEQCIVEYEPGSVSHRAAALKRYVDDWTGYEIAFLYLPETIHRFRRKKKTDGASPKAWEFYPGQDEEGEAEYPLENTLGVVPMVEFLNDPSVTRKPRSEIGRVMPIQNGVNMLTANMFVASEFSAFRQRYVLGWTPEADPETGAPGAREMEAAVSRLLTFNSADVKVGEFSETNLKNYVDAIEMLVHHIAAQTRTPRHYFFQTGQSPSGDAIKSAETGLVAKVRDRMLFAGERWEEVIRLGFAVLGDDAAANAARMEVRWADPEYRTEAELTDATIKQLQAGLITWEAAVERLGYTDEQIKKMRSDRIRTEVLSQAVDLDTLAPEEPAA